MCPYVRPSVIFGKKNRRKNAINDNLRSESHSGCIFCHLGRILLPARAGWEDLHVLSSTILWENLNVFLSVISAQQKQKQQQQQQQRNAIQ